MPEIYHANHPIFQSKNSLIYRTLIGEMDETFPYSTAILISHSSNWFLTSGEYMNTHSKQFEVNYKALSEYLRKHIVDDVYISENSIHFTNHNAEMNTSYYNTPLEEYFKRGESGKLIRHPAACTVNYIKLLFRDEVDKTQLILMNDNQYEIFDDLNKIVEERNSNRYDIPEWAKICPVCKVEHNDNNDKVEDS